MVAFIDAHRERYGVEPICAVRPIAPATYYEQQARQADPTRLPARAQRDAALRPEMVRVKTEVIRHAGPWRGLADVEYATLEWVAWYHTQRLLEPLGYVPPAEYEQHFHRALTTPAAAGVLT